MMESSGSGQVSVTAADDCAVVLENIDGVVVSLAEFPVKLLNNEALRLGDWTGADRGTTIATMAILKHILIV